LVPGREMFPHPPKAEVYGFASSTTSVKRKLVHTMRIPLRDRRA